MKNVRTVFLKEFRTYFNSPMAYMVLIVFLLISGWFFTSSLFLVNQSTLENFLSVTPLLFTFFIPALSMRLFSEETKTGTLEILVTLPAEDWELALGKYLSALAVIIIGIGLTLIYPLTLVILGKIDLGQIFTTYLGLCFLAAGFLSIGIFSSSLTQNQVVAFILGFLFCFLLFMLGKTLRLLPGGMASFLEYLSVDAHLDNFFKGVIDSRDLIYYLSIIGIFFSSTLYFLGRRRFR